MDGIIIVHKEPGFTSHDVVAKLRGILRQKRIGHTGTLDPEAAGVLPVCLGKATKVCGLLTDWNKTYRATLLLGRTTDTQDTTGKILRECPVFLAKSHDAAKRERAADGKKHRMEDEPVYLTEEEIRRCIAGFVGTGSQIPPMYSALKVNGKKLYELARQGIEVERKPRAIHIDEIKIERIARFAPDGEQPAEADAAAQGAQPMIAVEMTVRCSKGTYIRTLCNDIGERLGCGGCMDVLLRTEVGPFAERDSWRLSEIEQLRDADSLEECVFSTDCAFTNLDAVWLTADAERLVRNGNLLSARMMGSCRKVDDLSERFSDRQSMAYKNWMVLSGRAESAAFFGEPYGGPAHRADQLRVYAPNGEFLAVYGYEREKDCWRAQKMFL
ncbi:MAG: tRNA pseudouridine(55) synthase TruB [Lachnospiraceae bacterium]|nr:tRNA pseudouridine(55) synthase TruB [Lachnospiraceae bacterium]